ncbi:MAG: putative DNA-binding protein [Lachnospiraceae bacterium]|nr:putative DNA-binding protein [Lachnospiraceae bacterium]
MEKHVRDSLMFDFYGELLTEHQRNVMESFINDDMSYSEIAENLEISRQAVYDLIKRINKQLNSYEDKLHLVEKFIQARDKMDDLTSAISDLRDENMNSVYTGDQSMQKALDKKLKNIEDTSKQIFEEF